MADAFALPAPGLKALDMLTANSAAAGKFNPASKAKAKQASEDFEAVFLNSMFQQMFTGIEGDGPFGGKGSSGVWRSFLTDEYSKSFAKAGGIGIADQVYQTLIAQQEARS
jgi:Rod binding domain-containing protein